MKRWKTVACLMAGYTPNPPWWVKAAGFFFPMYRIRYEGRMTREHFARVRRAQRRVSR